MWIEMCTWNLIGFLVFFPAYFIYFIWAWADPAAFPEPTQNPDEWWYIAIMRWAREDTFIYRLLFPEIDWNVGLIFFIHWLSCIPLLIPGILIFITFIPWIISFVYVYSNYPFYAGPPNVYNGPQIAY